MWPEVRLSVLLGWNREVEVGGVVGGVVFYFRVLLGGFPGAVCAGRGLFAVGMGLRVCCAVFLVWLRGGGCAWCGVCCVVCSAVGGARGEMCVVLAYTLCRAWGAQSCAPGVLPGVVWFGGVGVCPWGAGVVAWAVLPGPGLLGVLCVPGAGFLVRCWRVGGCVGCWVLWVAGWLRCGAVVVPCCCRRGAAVLAGGGLIRVRAGWVFSGGGLARGWAAGVRVAAG